MELALLLLHFITIQQANQKFSLVKSFINSLMVLSDDICQHLTISGLDAIQKNQREPSKLKWVQKLYAWILLPLSNFLARKCTLPEDNDWRVREAFKKKKLRNIWNFPYVGWPPPQHMENLPWFFYCLKMISDSFWDFLIFSP